MQGLRKFDATISPQRRLTRTINELGQLQKMTYELRIHGRTEHQYETPEEAEMRARALLADNADCEIEIFDLSTGRPYAPAASAQDRETMSREIGF